MPTHHVIIGGGPAATNALETIRDFDGGESRITLISDEPAHSRMALPYWLCGNIPAEHTHTADDAYYKKLNVDARIGLRVDRVDSSSKKLQLSDGSSLDFDNLLISTGSSPLQLPIPGTDLEGVQPLWSLAHTDSALKHADGLERPRVVFVGAGFIGFIVLNAMHKNNWKLSVVERESQVLPRMLDKGAADMVQDWLATRDVDVHVSETVKSISQADDGSKSVELESGKSISADLVIIATGIRANLELIDGAGIEVDEGILVNGRMQTNFPFIYAAGDVAQGPSLLGGEHEIHAIQPTAVDHGRVAGANMAGQDVVYPGSLIMNVVDVCGLQTASYGNWDDAAAEEMTISNPQRRIYRKLLWTGDNLTGAIFTGPANDVGMLTDVGMVKGILQTKTPLGPWKNFLAENPFDIRRAYIASGVARKLVDITLIGRPAKTRQFQFASAKAKAQAQVGAAHGVFVGTKTS